jgi:hypothetical protein
MYPATQNFPITTSGTIDNQQLQIFVNAGEA